RPRASPILATRRRSIRGATTRASSMPSPPATRPARAFASMPTTAASRISSRSIARRRPSQPIAQAERTEVPLFTGVVPPVVTPLTASFEVDYPSYERVLEHLIGNGVHGLFVLGSTSEVVFHNEATRRAIVERAVKIANGRVPVFVGAIDPATDRVIGHARVAQQ